MTDEECKARDKAFIEGRAAMQLLNLMNDISEEAYCAGWMGGLETALWKHLHGDGVTDYGNMELGEDQKVVLRSLHELAGGWWYWHEEYGRLFVTTEEWLRSYNG